MTGRLDRRALLIRHATEITAGFDMPDREAEALVRAVLADHPDLTDPAEIARLALPGSQKTPSSEVEKPEPTPEKPVSSPQKPGPIGSGYPITDPDTGLPIYRKGLRPGEHCHDHKSATLDPRGMVLMIHAKCGAQAPNLHTTELPVHTTCPDCATLRNHPTTK